MCPQCLRHTASIVSKVSVVSEVPAVSEIPIQCENVEMLVWSTTGFVQCL